MTPIDFALLPTTVLRHPPIRHRGEDVDAGLTVGEMALLTAIVGLARAKKMMTFSGSQSELLRVAGLSRNAAQLAGLPAALDRLAAPIERGDLSVPPLLREWHRYSPQALSMTIEPAWLPTAKYDRVPLPVPTAGGGATTLALYLFLCAADLRRHRRPPVSIWWETLCRRLGIPLDRPANASRALDRALASVNAHRVRLGLDAHYGVIPIEGGEQVRFVELALGESVPAEAGDDALTRGEIEEAARQERYQRERQRREAEREQFKQIIRTLGGK